MEIIVQKLFSVLTSSWSISWR